MLDVRKLIFWCLLVLFTVSAFGCHTIQGVGQDIERAGAALENALE